MSLKSSHLLSWLCKETFLLEFLRHPCDHKSWKENLLHNLSNQYKLLKWVTIHIWFSFLRISWGFLFSSFLSKYRETSLARFSNKNSFYMMKLKPFSMSSLCVGKLLLASGHPSVGVIENLSCFFRRDNGHRIPKVTQIINFADI